MDTFDILTFALVLLFAAYVVVRVRQLIITCSQMRAGKPSSSVNPVKLYRERQTIVDNARRDYPGIFGRKS